MTERGDAIIFLSDFSDPQCPTPPPPDATMLNYLNGRDGAPLFLWDFGAIPNAHQDATILNYLTDREGGGDYLLYDFDAPKFPLSPTPQY